MSHQDDSGEGEDALVLAELTETVTRRIEAGEPVTGDDLGDDPACAGPIGGLLPTLRAMVSLGDQIAREDVARIRSRARCRG